jgi:hypothetical protein
LVSIFLLTSDVDAQVDCMTGDVDAQVDVTDDGDEPVAPMPTPYGETPTELPGAETLFLVGACTASSASLFV